MFGLPGLEGDKGEVGAHPVSKGCQGYQEEEDGVGCGGREHILPATPAYYYNKSVKGRGSQEGPGVNPDQALNETKQIPPTTPTTYPPPTHTRFKF